MPSPHNQVPHRAAVRWLIVIDSAGVALARFYLESRRLANEIDAGSEEVAVMTRGLVPEQGAGGPEWDEALAGHTDAERRAATVFRLDV